MRTLSKYAAALLLLGCASRAVYGQALITEDKGFFNSGLNAPETPASDVIGANTNKLTQPGSAAAFGAALLNGFDVNGNFKTGLAISISPYLLVESARAQQDSDLGDTGLVTIQLYNENPLVKFLAQTSFSVATAKGATDADKSVQLGFGLRSVLFNAGDPIGDPEVGVCTGKASQDALPVLKAYGWQPGDPEDTPEQKAAKAKAFQAAKAVYAAAVTKCRTAGAARWWNRSAWDIRAGDAFVSTNGAYNAVKQQDYKVGTTFGYGFDGLQRVSTDALKTAHWLTQNAQILIGVNYANAEIVPDPAKKGSFLTQSALEAGGQFRFRFWSMSAGTADDKDFSFHNTLGTLTAVFTSASPVGKSHSDSATVSVGVELKLSDSIYLDVGTGVQTPQTNGNLTKFVSTQIKYNLGSTSGLFGN